MTAMVVWDGDGLDAWTEWNLASRLCCHWYGGIICPLASMVMVSLWPDITEQKSPGLNLNLDRGTHRKSGDPANTCQSWGNIFIHMIRSSSSSGLSV